MKKHYFILILFSIYAPIVGTYGQMTSAKNVNAVKTRSGVKQQYTPLSFSQVNITDNFWKPRIETVATATLNACIEQTEVKTARIRNFEKVAKKQGKHEGIFYDDSDVFKALEAIAYSLKTKPNAALEKKADEWIDKIAAAQLPDGYLNTFYTLGELNKRWTDMSMHEDYNGGHMIEAAVAYFDATGKRKFLDVAIRWADHFDSLFGPNKKHWVTGHQELELALVKLYKATKNEKYLRLAHWLLEERGHKLGVGYTWTDWKDTAYTQDVVPVREQKEITGHAVRAMYLYTGAADVAALTGDEGYLNAMKTVWEDVVYRNMYITGGIGSSGSNEGFSIDYDLPNENAYCETCASVGMVLWNQRMNILTGESKYIDVLERSLYNGALDGLSLTGDRFFYGNPLASNGKHARREWFGTACCPANIARLVTSLGDYIYGVSTEGVWVNLFIGSNTNVKIVNNEVALNMQTNYPWDGNIKLTVSPQSILPKNKTKGSKFKLYLRIPGWANSQPVPGDLYRYDSFKMPDYKVTINSKKEEYTVEKGYIIIDREWLKNDVVDIQFPMNVQRIVSKDDVKMNNDRVALQRGPLVYCIEGADNEGKALNVVLPDKANFTHTFNKDLLGGIVTLKAPMTVIEPTEDGLSVVSKTKSVTAIPYFSWCNRGSNAMQVWLPRKIKNVRLND